jgi:hypothetical protein
MNAHIIVGKVLKPQGVRGEVKISPYTEDLSRFKKMKYLIIESTGASSVRARHIISDLLTESQYSPESPPSERKVVLARRVKFVTSKQSAEDGGSS